MSALIKRPDAIKIMACEMYAEAQSQGYEVDSIEDFMPEAKAWLNDAPSIDIVRCRECRYFIDNLTEDDTDEAYDACRWDWGRQIPRHDDYCSRGEREGE